MGDERKSVKEKMAEMLVLPKEIILDLPKITMIGSNQIFIENYKGIIEYDNQKIRINTGMGVIKIFGEKLEINTVTNEEIFITGSISNLEFS